MTGEDHRTAEVDLFSVPTAFGARLIRLTPDGRLPCATWIEGDVVEMGGSGVRVITAEGFAVGDLVCLAFLIPDTEEEMRLYGRVIAASRCGQSTELRAAFIGIAESERSAILRYAYRLQIRVAVDAGSVSRADR